MGQLEYAALDAHCLLQVWDMLMPSDENLAASTVNLSRQAAGMESSSDNGSSHVAKGPSLELRVGVVMSATSVSGAEDLLSCTIDLGPNGHRHSVQGCLVVPGQRVLAICNLVDREIFGVLSQAGLLVAYY